MKLIKELSAMVDEELGDAKKYIKAALNHKADNPVLAKTFYDLSTDELRHASILQAEVTRAVDQNKGMTGEVPEAMRGVYDYLKERQVEAVKAVKAYQSIYRGE